MDAAFLKWLGEAYGPFAPLMAVLIWFAWKNKDKKPDIAKELMTKIEGIDAKVNIVIEKQQGQGERIAKMEGKLDHD